MNATLSAAAVAILVASLAAGPVAAAPGPQKICKAPITTFGQHKILSKARQIARTGWINQTTGAYGAAWADIYKAKVQLNDCTHMANGWTCQFRAQPCMMPPKLDEFAPGTKPVFRNPAKRTQ